MANVQWIRITTDMFDNRKIRYIRTLPEGNSIILIWVMLLTEAGRCNSHGFIFLTENIPYTTSALANALGFNENVVIIALNALEQMNMIQRDCDSIVISNWEEYQNVDGLEKIREQNRLRKQKQRTREKSLLSMSRDNDVTVTDEITQSHATEKELEKEEELDIKHNKYMCDFELLWSEYPRKKEKAKAHKCYQARLKEGYSSEEMLQAVKSYAIECKKNNVEDKYIKLCSTFLGPNIPFTDYTNKGVDQNGTGTEFGTDNQSADDGDIIALAIRAKQQREQQGK